MAPKRVLAPMAKSTSKVNAKVSKPKAKAKPAAVAKPSAEAKPPAKSDDAKSTAEENS